jgi:hypothetical protein
VARRWPAILSLARGAAGPVSLLLLGGAPSLGLDERLAGCSLVVWHIVVGGCLLWSATRSERSAPT